MTDSLFLQGALRYENYEDFDSEILFQLANRLELTDTWNARASVELVSGSGRQGTVYRLVSLMVSQSQPVCSQLAATVAQAQTRATQA